MNLEYGEMITQQYPFKTTAFCSTLNSEDLLFYGLQSHQKQAI